MSFFRKPTPLPTQQGGTGNQYFDYGYAVIGNGYGALLELTPSTTGNVMTSNGTTWTSAPATGVTKDANGNITVNAVYTGFTNVAAAGTTTTLTAASTPNFVVTGSGGQTYQLPDATTLPNGAIFTFNNNQSSGTIIVKNNSGTTIVTVQSGGFFVVVLLSNSIAAGSWDYHAQAPSNVSWSTNTLNYVGSITGATWNGTAVGALYGGTGNNSAFTTNGVVYATSTSALTTGSVLQFNGTNLGLGASASSWGSGTNAIDLATSGSAGALSSSGTLSIASNGYFNGTNWIYKNSNYAQLYQMISGKHSWQIAPVGTAGNAITFTQAMTLSAGGNLVIGDTSGNGKLSVRDSSAALQEIYTTAGTNYAALEVKNTGGSFYIGRDNSAGSFFASNTAYASCLYSSGAYPMVFFTNGTERARFTSGDYFMVGTTTNFPGSGNNNSGFFVEGSTGSTFISRYGDAALFLNRGSSAGSILTFSSAGNIVASISITSSSVSYNNTSDQRLKRNIVDAPQGNIDAIKVRSFDWLTDNRHQEYGMIAQELIEVAPYAVYKPEKEEEMMGIDYSKLVPMMIKEIQQLKAEVALLKGK